MRGTKAEPLLSPADFATLRRLIRDEARRMESGTCLLCGPAHRRGTLDHLDRIKVALTRLEITGRFT